MRDQVVRWALAAGAFAGLLAWWSLGPWAGMVPVLAALLVASVAYRIEPPRIDLESPLPPLEAGMDELAQAPSPRIDQ